MAVTRLAGVKGMNDILPAEAGRWERLEEVVAAWARSYGYQRIRTPIVEPTALFARGLGQVTDIVEVWFDSGSTHAFCLEQRRRAFFGIGEFGRDPFQPLIQLLQAIR